MSLQFDPRLLLEENEQRLEDTLNRLASVSSTVSKGIFDFCISRNCTVTSVRNQFSALVREEANLKNTLSNIKNNIRLLTKEIEFRTTPFFQPQITTQLESIDIDPEIIIQKSEIDLKTVALIGGGLLLLS